MVQMTWKVAVPVKGKSFVVLSICQHRDTIGKPADFSG